MGSNEFIIFIEEQFALLLNSLERDFWDYAAIIIPAAISIISIAISVIALCRSNDIGEQQNKISEKQNNIALFEHRFKAFKTLAFLLSVARMMLESKNKTEAVQNILTSGMLTYEGSAPPVDTPVDFSRVYRFYTDLTLEIGRAPFLFRDENTEVILSFSASLFSIVSNVYTGKSYEEEIISLKSYVLKIDESNLMLKLEKYLML